MPVQAAPETGIDAGSKTEPFRRQTKPPAHPMSQDSQHSLPIKLLIRAKLILHTKQLF